MDVNKDVHPYNAVSKTRSGYYPKWLMTMSRNTDCIVWRRNGHHVIKASCLNHGNPQNMIMDGDGIPLPVDFGEVIDLLETWGAWHWTGWLEHALQVMHEHLREDNMHGGVAPNKMRLFYDIILVCVQRETMFCSISNSASYNRVLENWNTYFWVRCREINSFHDIACDSIECITGMIRSIRRENRAENPSTPSGNMTLLTSHATVVPESPVSSATHAGESTQE